MKRLFVFLCALALFVGPLVHAQGLGPGVVVWGLGASGDSPPYGIVGDTAGEEAYEALLNLKELQAPQRALRKMYFSSEVGGDIPTIGADANDCLSIAAPCLTFARASVVCGGLTDCIFDAQDTWTGANIDNGLDITTSDIGGDFVSTRLRSSDPNTRVHVDCAGSTSVDGIFIASAGTDWISFEGWDITCDNSVLAAAIDAFDSKVDTKSLIINTHCTWIADAIDDQCYTAHGTGAIDTGSLMVNINTSSSMTDDGAGTVGANFQPEPASENTHVAIGDGLHTITNVTGVAVIAKPSLYGRYYFLGHSFSGTGNNSVSVITLAVASCTDCYFVFARTNVSDMVDNVPASDTYLLDEAIGAGRSVSLETYQVTVANQERFLRFNGAGGTVSWNGSGVLFENPTNYSIYTSAARSLGGAALLTGTITEVVYDLTDPSDFYAAGANRTTVALFNANMGAGFSFAEDAGSADGLSGTLLANSSACDQADPLCFNAHSSTYTISPLFLDAAIVFPADILGAEFSNITLSGGNIGAR